MALDGRILRPGREHLCRRVTGQGQGHVGAERVPRHDWSPLGGENLVARLGPGEGGLGWNVNRVGPTVTAAWLPQV